MAKHKQLSKQPIQAQPTAKSTSALPISGTSQINRSIGWFGVLVALLGFILYANTFGHQYVLDDFSCLKENYLVQGGLKNIGTFFTTEYRYGFKGWGGTGSLYRPAALSMFAFEWMLAPDKPYFYHFVNALFYALTGWLLWATWRRILIGYPLALTAMAVLLFMAHPIHTEVVANIKSLDEIMATLFSTAALYGIWRYFEREQTSWLAAAALFLGIGLFFKESSITFLGIIPLCIWFFTDKSIGQNLKVTGLMLLPAAIFLLARQNALASQPGSEDVSLLDNFIVAANNNASRLASALMMCWEYLQKLLFPHPLVNEMGYPQKAPVTFGDFRAILGLVVYGSMFVWAVLNVRKKHFMAFVVLFYLVTFSLYSNIFMMIGTSYGERLMYVPSFGFALALAWLICKLFNINDLNNLWNPAGKGLAVWGITAAIVFLYGIKTVLRNPTWRDSLSLYTTDVQIAPNSAKMNLHTGLEYADLAVNEKQLKVVDPEMLKKAVTHFEKAIQLYPQYHDAFGGLGRAHFWLQNYDKAFENYQEALKYRPNDAKVLSNLGYIYFLRSQKNGNANNDLAKAEEVYRKAVEINPRLVDARQNLGTSFALRQRFPEAIEQWKKGLEIEPNNPSLLKFIGSAYRDMGQPEAAAPWLEKARQAGAQ